MIKDRRIEITADEAVALATRDVKVECVSDEGGFMDLWDVLDDFTFFAPESALTAFTEPTEPPKPMPRTTKPTTPEERTARLVEHVDSTPDDPKQAAIEAELAGETPDPFGHPLNRQGGGDEKVKSGKIKINGHAKPEPVATVPRDFGIMRHEPTTWTDAQLGVMGLMRYTADAKGKRTTKWSLKRLASYFGVENTDTIVEALAVYQLNEAKYNKAAEAYELPNTKAGRSTWETIKKKEGNK